MRSQKSRIASGGVAAAAHADERGHARIVPAADVLLLHQLEQLALAHHRVAEIEPRELDLARTWRAPGRLSISQS